MKELTIIVWAAIFIIGVIAIILVKLHFKNDKVESNENPIISEETIGEIRSYGQRSANERIPTKQYTQPELNNAQVITRNKYEKPITRKVEESNYKNIEYESQNQVLVNYGNEIKESPKSIIENQDEIMAQDNEKHELKDLFTIDELIKESKRKDSEREKESQQIQKDENDEEMNELKESIRKRKESEKAEEQLLDEKEDSAEEVVEVEETKEETIQDIINSTEEPTPEAETKEETIQDIINSTEEPTPEAETKEETIEDIISTTETEETEEDVQEVLEVEETKEETIQDIINDTSSETKEEVPSVATQKDIAEAIDNASQEPEEEIESISENEDITGVLLNSEEEIKEPTLKSPTKIDSSDDFGSSRLVEEENDLDYRKDLARIKNTITGSKLFQDVKERLTAEPDTGYEPISDLEETYIRNVNEYEDEYEPIINETHDEFGEVYEPDYDQVIREENTRRLFNNVQNTTPEPEFIEPIVEPIAEPIVEPVAEPIIETIKPKPTRGNIKIQMGNSEAVLKKGDEIIFKHDGETYSSQVYGISGDDISVKYRGKSIIIKPDDVKKIY